MHRAVIAVEQEVFGPEHEHTLTTTVNLGLALQAQGDYAQAEAIFHEVLAIRQRIRTRSDVDMDTLTLFMNLANALKTSTRKQPRYTNTHLRLCSACWGPSTLTH
jgi:hypothetical protein